MNTHRITISITTEHPFERAAFRALFALAGILIVCYGYFVALSVFNVIARKEAIAESVRLGAGVARLEEEYFALSESVTPERGMSLGLVHSPAPLFVYRPGAVGQARTGNEI